MTVPFTLKYSTEPLKLWEKIEIIVGEGSSAGHYVSRIEDFDNANIVITPPEFESGNALLRNGCRCMVLLTRKDAVYQFDTRIRTVKTSKGKKYLLESPGNVRRVQRRQFVRIEVWQKITYALVPSDNQEISEPNELEWIEGTVVDISGGGVLLKTNREIKEGTLVVFRLEFLAESGLPSIIAAVCRRSFKNDKIPMSGFELLRYEQLTRAYDSTRLKLLPESVRAFDIIAQNNLVNFVFKRQVELRKKGLL
ncbi:MAG: hypothetical protein DRP47_00645 [Candidatus Zixiibacteriota bacterium]|nr:MAG: hypothetical protein DRP47_00645 [candidate division Zixibacteria bacterium]